MQLFDDKLHASIFKPHYSYRTKCEAKYPIRNKSNTLR